MIFGVSGQPLPGGIAYGSEISQAAAQTNFPPCWLYAHGYQETIKVAGWMETMGKTPANFISDDGGHGIFQLTASYPPNWQVPYANACYAVIQYLMPAIKYWNSTYGLLGDQLMRCVAAEYNAGRSNAEAGHNHGDVGMFTTKDADGNEYPDLVMKYYHQLAAGQKPSG